MCRLSWNLGATTSWNPQGLSRPVIGLFYSRFMILLAIYFDFRWPCSLASVDRINPTQYWSDRTERTFLCGWHCVGHYTPPVQHTCRRSCRISTALEVEFYARYPVNSNVTFIPTTRHVSWLIVFISLERIVPALLLCSLTCRQVSVKLTCSRNPKWVCTKI
jgi:hypothetical protein